MKLLFALLLIAPAAFGQSIVGKWQLTDEKTCLTSELGKSETESELESAMNSSRNAVARMIIFKKDGSGEEGVFSVGKKKGSGMNSFKYRIEGNQLLFLDKKSGMITQRFILEEFGSGTLKIRNATRDCEVRTFTKAN